ncbi:MAG: methyltransferase [Bacteroidota bacterium]|jgi:ubiquinone/menaquinone biosynthesis C-methylase UbiE
MTESLSPNIIREIAYRFQSSRILLTAFELGVFTELGNRKRSSSEVARALKTDPRATDRLMNALCAMKMLVKKNGRFQNTPVASRFLVKGKPEFTSGLMHTVHLWDTWTTLTAAVRKGTSVAVRPEINSRGDTWLTAFIAAMHDRAAKQAPAVVAQMDLSSVSRVLDVGSGSGAFAMAFVKAKEGITATVFDLPNVLPLTKRYVRQAKLSGKVELQAGDYLMDDLGRGFDIVFLSAIVHSNSESENRKLIKKCARALNPNGRVVVQDFIMDDDRTAPLHGAFFALNMLVGTGSGDTYTESEVRSWMEEAGLSKIVRRETAFGVTQIIGKK